ncbi:MAG: CPBP family intramembrane metalloprotease [Cellulosilyticum sp.]|nr:CPBP family intramembrane metalloprotease [Cellulosilyticum sp.]
MRVRGDDNMRYIKQCLYVISVVLLMILVVFISTAILQLGIGLITECFNIALSEDVLYTLSGSGGIAAASLIGVLYVKKKKIALDVKANSRGNTSVLVYTLLSVCLCKILVDGIMGSILSVLYPMEPMQADVTSWVYYLSAIVVAPIFEELLFRYGLYNIIRQKMSHTFSMLLSAILFATIHGYQLQGFISCFVAAMVFTWIYRKTKDIRCSMLAHMSCNAFAIIMNVIQEAGIKLGGVPLQYGKNGYNMLHPVLIIFAIIVCGMILVKYLKREKEIIEENGYS